MKTIIFVFLCRHQPPPTTSSVILSMSADISIRGSRTFWEIVSRFLGKENFLGRPQETTGDQKLIMKKPYKNMKNSHKNV